MINLKGDIWIAGFGTIEDKDDKLRYLFHVSENMASELIYAGKTLDIPEEIAKECVIQYDIEKGELIDEFVVEEDILFGFKNYKEGFGVLDFQTAKESIQSACNREYCIIFKK